VRKAKVREPEPPSTALGTIHRLKIRLLDVRPPVWRRVEIASDAKLPEVGRALLAAMGWNDSHLPNTQTPQRDWKIFGRQLTRRRNRSDGSDGNSEDRNRQLRRAEGQESAVSDTGGAPSLDFVCVLGLPDWLLDGRLLRDLERAAHI